MEKKKKKQRQLTYFSIFLSLSLQQALISDFQIWLHAVLTKVSFSGFHIYSSSFDCPLLLYIPIISPKDQSLLYQFCHIGIGSIHLIYAEESNFEKHYQLFITLGSVTVTLSYYLPFTRGNIVTLVF